MNIVPVSPSTQSTEGNGHALPQVQGEIGNQLPNLTVAEASPEPVRKIRRMSKGKPPAPLHEALTERDVFHARVFNIYVEEACRTLYELRCEYISKADSFDKECQERCRQIELMLLERGFLCSVNHRFYLAWPYRLMNRHPYMAEFSPEEYAGYDFS